MAYTGNPELMKRVKNARRKLKQKRRVKAIVINTILLSFLFLLLFMLPTSPKRVYAPVVQTIKPAIEDVYLRSTINGYTYRWTFVKFNLSEFSGSTILSAKMGLYAVRKEGAISWEHRQWRVDNQGWTESIDSWELTNYTRDTETDIVYSDPEEQEYIEFDCTNIISTDIGEGNTNSTIRIEHPDYLTEHPYTTDNITLSDSILLDIGRHKTGDFGYIQFSSSEDIEARRPYLTIRTEPPVLEIEYDFPSYPNATTSIVPNKFWNNTKLLYLVYLRPYEDLTNVTIREISTSYTFAYIYPNVSDYTDNILSTGEITFYDLYEGTYEVILDPGQDWHTLHFGFSGPHGTGLKWETFRVYLNNTRVPYPPIHDLETGFYQYDIQDFFSQTILSGNFTISSVDSAHINKEYEVPLYEVAFHNGDLIPYRLEITRNNITREWPVPPKGGAIIPLYGLASNVPYEVVEYDTQGTEQTSDDIRITSYTLYVPNAPVGRYINHVNDERVDFPSYKWIQESFQTIQGQLVSQNQLVILIGVGLFITVLVQTQGILKNILRKPLVKRGKPK